MATAAGPVKQSSAPKNDAFVEAQLERARRRIPCSTCSPPPSASWPASWRSAW